MRFRISQQQEGLSMALKARRVLLVSMLAMFSGAVSSAAHSQTGIASVYSGGRTANGEYAHRGQMTAAHPSLPFGTLVRVTHKRTGRSVVVRINDRGPFVSGRIIDLTPAAAHAIGLSGLASVTVTVLGRS
jgi:peptidoglycan lytic transglycosylase